MLDAPFFVNCDFFVYVAPLRFVSGLVSGDFILFIVFHLIFNNPITTGLPSTCSAEGYQLSSALVGRMQDFNDSY